MFKTEILQKNDTVFSIRVTTCLRDIGGFTAMTPCSLVGIYRRFRFRCCFSTRTDQGQTTLINKTSGSSETSRYITRPQGVISEINYLNVFIRSVESVGNVVLNWFSAVCLCQRDFTLWQILD
jgi:hypothetical protein